jgi:phosphatidylserine decarboxylase
MAPSTRTNTRIITDMPTKEPALGDYLKSLPQYLLPLHAVSRVTLRLTRCTQPWFKNAFTRWFVRHFNVDMSLAQNPDVTGYVHFNEFFTRPLRPEARPIAHGAGEIACPVDGEVSQIGAIRDDVLFQAKGRTYSLVDLLGGDAQRAAPFRNGQFATLYLSPRDYHRIHMPLAGALREMVYVPGRLFAVNRATVKVIPRVFARNERVVALFDTAAGPLAMVLVGAVNVGCIETMWHGVVTPPPRSQVTTWNYGAERGNAVTLEHGAEMGRFNMGSTVIVLFGPGAMEWSPELSAGSPVRMGQLLGRRTA